MSNASKKISESVSAADSGIKIQLAEESKGQEFSGERYLPSVHGEIELEHIHRYLFATQFAEGKKVLDAACGEGYGCFMLSQKGSEVVGVDIDEPTIRAASTKYTSPNLKFLTADCLTIPYPDLYFDLIVSFETLEHLTEHSRFIAELRRLLKPGGMLIISSPNREAYNSARVAPNPFHKKELSQSEFGQLLKEHFTYYSTLSQNNAFASHLETADSASHYKVLKRQENDVIQTSEVSEDPQFIVACASDTPIPELNTSVYVLPNSTYFLSALKGGIEERDQKIVRLENELRNLNQIREEQISKLELAEKSSRQAQESLQPILNKNTELRAKLKVELEESRRRGAALAVETHEKYLALKRLSAATAEAAGLNRKLKNTRALVQREGNWGQDSASKLDFLINDFKRSSRLQVSKRKKLLRKIIQTSGLFDREYYLSFFPGLKTDPIAHYLRTNESKRIEPHILLDREYYECQSGPLSCPLLVDYLIERQHTKSFSPHPLFNPDWYKNQLPSNHWAERFPLLHFLYVGAFCGLSPHPLFDGPGYFERNVDVYESKQNPLIHYLKYGFRENRQAHPCLDPDFYRTQIEGEADLEPVQHYLKIGRHKNFRPNLLFDPLYYKSVYPDVVSVGADPFLHYLEHGENELRNPHPYFNVRYYLEQYPDVAAAQAPALAHFLSCGLLEGRIPCRDFDLTFHLGRWKSEIPEGKPPFLDFLERYYELIRAPEKFDYSKLLLPITNNLLGNSEIVGEGSPQAPEASIIIPIYGKVSITLRCLLALSKHVSRFTFEIIIVDDKSTDNSLKVLSQFPKIRVISEEINLGFISSCNLGADKSRGKYLIFLNNDTEVLNGWLDELIGTFSHHKNVGLVGSKLLYPGGSLQEAGAIIWQDGSGWNYGRNEDRNNPDFNFLRDVDYCSGASICLEKSVFEDLNKFDLKYAPAYYEDSDLAFKVAASGKRVLYQPFSQVVHFEGVSSGTSTENGVKSYQIKNAIKFFETWKNTLSGHGVNAIRPDLESNRKKHSRVLFFDATTPTPDRDGGSLIAFNWMRILSELGYAVSFIPEDNLSYDSIYTPMLQREGVRCLYRPYVHSLMEIISKDPGEIPLVVIFRYMVGEKILTFIKEFQPQAKTILHNIDLHYLRMMRQAELENSPELKAEAEEVKRIELKVHGAVDLACTHSEFEKAEVLKHVPTANVDISPLIHDCHPSGIGFNERRDMCFLGGFGHPPNIDAVIFFAETVMPLLRQRKIGARFIVVGSSPTDEILKLQSDDILVLGHVPDLAPIFSRIRISVAPIRYGAGVKNKVGLSMGYGVPVVATAVAAEGMNLRDGQDVLVADNPEDLCEQICKLYTDESLWNSISSAGLELTEQQYSINANKKLLAKQLGALGLKVPNVSS